MSGAELLRWLASPQGQLRYDQRTATQYATCIRSVLSVQPLGLLTEFDEHDLDQIAAQFGSEQDGRSRQTVNTYMSSFKAAARAYQAARAAGHVRAWDFPLRPDLSVTLHLPVDLRPAEAQRVARFVYTLAAEHDVPPCAPSTRHSKTT